MQNKYRLSPAQLFSRTKVQIKSKHWQPFGCPVYVLNEALQANQPDHKCKEQAHIGICLGQSPIHNRNVALVMHKNMGHVSPQFHVKFDKRFHTLSQEDLDTKWQRNTFFTSENSKPLEIDEQPDPLPIAKIPKTAHR